MGTMPLSLAKGVIGLRLDYLTQFQSVRNHVKPRLENWLQTQAQDDHPANVLRAIEVYDVKIDILGDKKAEFVKKINYLLTKEQSLDPNWDHYGNGKKYVKHDSTLHPANQDATGNRKAFMEWWMYQADNNPDLFSVIAQKIVDALGTNNPHIEFWWDCTLPDGAAATAEVEYRDTVVRVLFRTDESADDPDLDKRDPDPEPSNPDDIFVP